MTPVAAGEVERVACEMYVAAEMAEATQHRGSVPDAVRENRHALWGAFHQTHPERLRWLGAARWHIAALAAEREAGAVVLDEKASAWRRGRVNPVVVGIEAAYRDGASALRARGGGG